MADRCRAVITPTGLFFVLLGILAAARIDCADWSYSGASGPTAWTAKYPTCKGSNQSPIDLKTCMTTHSPQLIWLYYNLKPDRMRIANNGHSIVVTATYPSNRNKPQIKIADDKTYELDNVHFHWGKNNNEGSEHTFRNKRYSLEMHAVHKRVNNGTSGGDILVVGVLFDVTLWNHPGLQRFIINVKKVIKPETEYQMDAFKWSDLLTEFNNGYYTYQGSLTTPPCSEVVTWIVRNATEKVSYKQLRLFRLLKNDEGAPLAGNWRPTQELNGRQVRYVTV